ncbi:alpha/beta fold hydrolase [Roseobacter sp. TSBP12]|uniref:alpha/beta fold hydrolase n=1 Tax=Roseobacter sp. TSBP12 TaxID=1236613 RepID=UPI001D001D4B|nr:alpha/beta fold hydrolase [Roseobacter sp. TSBP12]
MSELGTSDPVFLLVHGSAHGAWCWRDLVPALGARGATAHAMDLPSHGDDPTPYTEVTLDLYRDAILHKISEIGAPVILVGHSAGGYAITAAAEAAPERIAQLIYVCAYVPEDGKSLVTCAAVPVLIRCWPRLQKPRTARLSPFALTPSRRRCFMIAQLKPWPMPCCIWDRRRSARKKRP